MAEILEFNGHTLADIPVEKVKEAIPDDLELLLVIGVHSNEGVYIASSSGDIALNVFMLEKGKRILMDWDE